MSFFKEFGLGVRSYSTAWKFISKHNLWSYTILPGVINICLMVLIGIGAYFYGSAVSAQLNEWFNIETEWLRKLLYWFVVILIRVVTAILFYYSYRYLMLIFLSPALALFAEKILEVQTGEKRPFVLKQFVSDVIRGITLAVRNLFFELLLILLFVIIGFIPIVGLITPFLSFFTSSFYQGFSMIDYRSELKQMTVKESITYVRNHRGLALGNGAIFGLLLFIPFFGAMFAPMLALTAAQLSVSELEDKERELRELEADKTRMSQAGN